MSSNGGDPFSLGPAYGASGTAKALRCVLYNTTADMELGSNPVKELWVPLSVIHDDSECWGIGDKGELFVAYWWARKEGLTDD